MAYIKEPKGIDFVINGKPLTEEQKQTISAFIENDKKQASRIRLRNAKKSLSTTRKKSIIPKQ